MIELHEEEEVEGDVGSEVLDIPDPLMVLIPEGNGSLSGTVAVIERKNSLHSVVLVTSMIKCNECHF